MVETSLEELVEERQFAGLLQTRAEVFFRLSNTLLAHGHTGRTWTKSHFGQLCTEANALESFLDDFGARYNRTYADLTDLVASLRWFASAGTSISHLLGRLDTYGPDLWNGSQATDEARAGIEGGCQNLRDTVLRLLQAVREETRRLGIEITREVFPEASLLPLASRLKLPRNVGQEELVDEEQKIAEVATKFLQAADMIAETGIRPVANADERHQLFARVCTEERARVYEARIHNLQSTYDTHIRNTVLEGRDDRLPKLRGHASVALHMLQAVTDLAHFLERHESDLREGLPRRKVFELVERSEVERMVVEVFLLGAHTVLQSGRPLAEHLLPAYTNVCEVVIELPAHLVMHARPAALIVGVVNHYGTPVELELGSHRCNAGSILELLVAVGSNPEERRFVFRGDERPLRDIQELFAANLGEDGVESLPKHLRYLRVS